MLHCVRRCCIVSVSAILVIMCLNNCVWGTDNLDLPVSSLNPKLEIKESCDYINVDNTLHCDQNSLTCVQMNVWGISSKKTEVKYLIDHCLYNDTPDVLLLCETWLTPFSPVLKFQATRHFNAIELVRKEEVWQSYWLKNIDVKHLT